MGASKSLEGRFVEGKEIVRWVFRIVGSSGLVTESQVVLVTRSLIRSKTTLIFPRDLVSRSRLFP